MLSRTCSGRASTCTVRSGGGERPHSPFYAGVPPCTPEVFAGLAAPAPTMRAFRAVALLIDARGRSPLCAPPWRGFQPRTPGDFLMRRKSPKTHQEPPGSWTSSEGGLAPFDPPALCPSGIGCGGLNLQASSGVPLPRHGLTAGSVTPV